MTSQPLTPERARELQARIESCERAIAALDPQVLHDLHMFLAVRWQDQVRHDELLAALHGAELPKLTPGAQAILTARGNRLHG